MSDPLKKRLRKKAKEVQRRKVQKALEKDGHHEREKKRAKNKNKKGSKRV